MADKWLFIIDTENFAGNFEREMTAYLSRYGLIVSVPFYDCNKHGFRDDYRYKE